MINILIKIKSDTNVFLYVYFSNYRAETPERKVLFTEDSPQQGESKSDENKNEKEETDKYVGKKFLLLVCSVLALVGVCYLKSRK